MLPVPCCIDCAEGAGDAGLLAKGVSNIARVAAYLMQIAVIVE